MFSFPYNILQVSAFVSCYRKWAGYRARLLIVCVAIAGVNGFSACSGQGDGSEEIKQDKSGAVAPVDAIDRTVSSMIGAVKGSLDSAEGNASTVTKKRFSADLVESLQVISVNLGTQFVGKTVKVEVSLKNALNHDLDLAVQPSCNCTGLSKTKINVTSGGVFAVLPDVQLPNSPQKFSSSIQFLDQQRAISFALVFEADVVDLVQLEPSLLVVTDSSSLFQASISVKPNIAGLSITRLVSSDERFRIIGAVDNTVSRCMVVVEPPDTLMTMEESFPIRVFYRTSTECEVTKSEGSDSEQLNDIKSRDCQVVVRYIDRIAIGPSISTWKFIDGRYYSKLYVRGLLPEKSLEQGKFRLTNGRVQIPVQVREFAKRTEKALIFEGSFDAKDLPSLDKDESWKFEIECLKYRASSEVVLERPE